MVCIYCGGKTRITNSRPQKRAHATWRRHLCLQCGALFTTQERVDFAASVTFVGAKGTLNPFSREILLQSLYESLKHRSDALTEALHLTDTVIGQLLPHVSNARLARDDVARVSYQVLQRFDKAAAVTYRAYHPAPTSRGQK